MKCPGYGRVDQTGKGLHRAIYKPGNDSAGGTLSFFIVLFVVYIVIKEK
jgi:hypothetical protein